MFPLQRKYKLLKVLKKKNSNVVQYQSDVNNWKSIFEVSFDKMP